MNDDSAQPHALIEQASLLQVTDEESDMDRRKRLQRETIASIRSFSAGERLSRDQIHERDTRYCPPVSPLKKA